MSHHQRKELIRRAQSGHIARIKTLLNDGADTGFVADTSMSPLMTAAYAGHSEVVTLLLAAGASPHLTADDGASALHWAARNGHHEIVCLLLDVGAKVNARRDADGPTPLHMAISNGHDAVAITLIDAGTSLDTQYIVGDVRKYAEWHGRDLVIQYINQRRGRPKRHGRGENVGLGRE
ncbi:MAG: ankyrin repeat domain-containing protein [Planctomycetes bacterium]|nr:ankyrin repeat domain-containing protein [Planctomycetota bacterium]